MALVQEPQSQREEALAAVLEVLRERVRKCGECQVTTKSLGSIICQRFGLYGAAGRFLVEFVLGYLVAKDILTFWDKNPKFTIYKVNTTALLHNV
jgi:hypothetical protein